MIFRNINFPLFARLEQNALDNLKDILKEENLFFKRIAILTGNYGEVLIKKKKLNMQFSKIIIFNLRKTKNISDIRTNLISENIELILTLGGGKINDIGKYISVETSIPLISIPTVLSNDGIASPISILRQNGEYKSLGTTPPIGVIADIDILMKTPAKYLLSGLGDLMSNISAVMDWELANKEIGEKIDIFSKNISLNSAIKVIYNFKMGLYTNIHSEIFLKDLFNGLIMSALSMIIAKSSRPASGAEHNISHALDKLGSNQLHGIQVGFATLFILFLYKEFNMLRDVLTIYNYFKFPTTFKNLKITENDFIKALKIAPFIRNRYTILNMYSINTIIEEFYKFINFIVK